MTGIIFMLHTIWQAPIRIIDFKNQLFRWRCTELTPFGTPNREIYIT